MNRHEKFHDEKYPRVKSGGTILPPMEGDIQTPVPGLSPDQAGAQPQGDAPQAAVAFETAIETAAERHAPGGHLRMPSGAGHDAQVISHKLRAGMMFIPSLKGVSHHWSENTKEEDIVLGAQVFADAAAAILKAG